jgi:hypothetical protein
MTDEVLRRGRVAGSRIAGVQIALAVLGVPALLLTDPPVGVAYALAGLVAALEAAGSAIGRNALRQAPSFSPEAHFATTPLRRSERRLVASNLVTCIAGLAFLIFVVGGDVAVLGCAMLAVSAFSLIRVLRGNSWLAISWVPAQPRARPPMT